MCEIWFPGSAPECRGVSPSDGRRHAVGEGGVGRGTIRSEGFSSYSLSNKTNGLPLPRMTANCGHKALYNHYRDYATFRRHLSCVWSPSRKRGVGVGVVGGVYSSRFLLIKLVSLCRAPALFITAAWDRCESLRACASMCVLECRRKQCAQQSCHT